jgi:1-aminocyclopropane-1-carboxylate deaminase/D-cysteine desulfhydrase-like pyridoxal-dependent ACC family enzyme
VRVPDARAVANLVDLTGDHLGPGYGHPTDQEGDAATVWFAERGIQLDPTYTAKTAAALRDLLDSRPHGNVLYWHTLSATAPPSDPRQVDGHRLPPA